jgi:hypothetical protein
VKNKKYIHCSSIGDRLNFGMAIEQIKSEKNYENIELVYIDDEAVIEHGLGAGRGLVAISHNESLMNETFRQEPHS